LVIVIAGQIRICIRRMRILAGSVTSLLLICGALEKHLVTYLLTRLADCVLHWYHM